MLPYVARTATAAVTALAIAAASIAPANALGRDERNFLKGVAATIIVGTIVKNSRAQAEAPRYSAPPRYVEPDPVYVPRNPGGSVYNTPAAQAFAAYSRHTRRGIQARLQDSGYYFGAIDGAFGPQTYRAISSYARDTGQGELLNSYRGSVSLLNGILG